MRHRGLCWGLALAVVATIGVGCASRNGGQAAGGSAAMRREADEFKAQAQQGLRDFAREKPAPPPCEVGYLTGRELTVLATSEWIERAGLRRGDRITSVDGVPASQLHNQPRPSARVPPGTPFSVGVSRAGREVTLTLICIPRPEVWIAARRTQEAAAQGDWAGCQAAALDYILAVGYMESLALEFHGRCGFHKAMMRGERFTLDLARDLYDWQSFRVREKSYEPGGLDEIRESVLGAVAVLRREGFRDYADRLEEQLRTAPARVAAEIAAAPAPATPSPSSVAQARPSTSAVPPPTSPQITPIAPPVPTSPAVSAPSQATSPPAPTPPAPTPPLTSAPPPPQVQRGSAPPQPSAPPRVSQGTAFFVRPDGVLLTALHVVDGARSVSVACPGREPVPAILASGTRNRDLVALKTSLSAPAYLTLHGARALLPGDPVFTVGFPTGTTAEAAPRFSDGSLNAVTGPDTETAFLQMTMPLQPGNAGGPVVAADGSAVGVVSSGAAIILLLREPGIFPQGVSWGIKADFAQPLFEAPPALPAARTWGEAVERATRSACRVLVTR
ncbi:MAG TPA: trypsin-like peptidase domain-containing protein [Methylomirabilota bacterium]|nr:trypsin-like peptidase domain-containing protein [Methylomirabilota bacterium]